MPRRTKLLSPYPTVQWSPIVGVDAYAVAIRGSQFFWAIRHSGTQFVYPASAPPLRPGVDYKLIVQAGDRSSSEEPGVGLGFSILDGKERAGVEKEQQRIESLGLPDGTAQFLIASLYAANGLRAEAIQRLEVISTQLKVAAVPRLMGDLYMEVGLIRQAEASYLKALDLCKAENDNEGLMVIHLALANIYENALGNNRLAKEHLHATLELANTIGDETTIDQAGKRLERLKKEGV
jgi:tetratricopeptide (TPR) repeat protein